MPAQHWFDTFHRTAIAATSRRDVMRAVAALLPGFLLGAGHIEAANKKKDGKGKKKNKGGKGKKPKRPDHLGPPDPDVDDCDRFFDDPEMQNDCKKDRPKCRVPNQFCIHALDIDDDESVPAYSCCTGGRKCCITGCKDTSSDPKYCGDCGPPCGEGENCVNGACQEACPEERQEESMGSASENSCGVGCGSGPPCTGDEKCWDGEHCSVCPPGEKLCQTSVFPEPTCVPMDSVCCPGNFTCANPDPAHPPGCCVCAGGQGSCTFRGQCPSGCEPVPPL